MSDTVPLPKKMQQWLNQPRTFVTADEMAFIDTVRRLSKKGVGYGFMAQMIEWIWQEEEPSLAEDKP